MRFSALLKNAEKTFFKKGIDIRLNWWYLIGVLRDKKTKKKRFKKMKKIIVAVAVSLAAVLLAVGFIFNNGLIAVSSVLSVFGGFFGSFLYEDYHE